MKRIWAVLRSHWNTSAAAAAWLGAVVSAVLLPPPVGALQFGGNGNIARLAGILTPLLVGLLTVPLLRRSSRRHAGFWWKIGVGCVIAAVAAYFAYTWYATDWTVPYNYRPLVIGSELTPHGRDYIARHPEFPAAEQLVMAHTGAVDEIWTKRSIDRRCAILCGWYIAAFTLFIAAIVCSLQAVYCFTGPRDSGAAGKSKSTPGAPPKPRRRFSKTFTPPKSGYESSETE